MRSFQLLRLVQFAALLGEGPILTFSPYHYINLRLDRNVLENPVLIQYRLDNLNKIVIETL